MDSEAVINAVRAISNGAEELEELVLRAMLDLAGAQDGLLFLERTGGAEVAARTKARGSLDNLPAELLAEVRRTGLPATRGAECCLPLVGRDGLVGAVLVGQEVEPGALAALTLVARHAAIALENAELRRQNERLETERESLQRSAEALRKSEELYRRAIVQAGAVPYVLDYARRSYTFMGEAIEELTGYTPAEVTPQILESLIEEVELLGEQAGYDLEEATRRTRAGDFARWRCDCRIRTRAGETRWFANAAVEILGDDGVSIGSIGMLQDITERKRTEEELSRFAAILEATTDFVGMADPEGRALYLNRAGRRLLGIGEDEDISTQSIPDVHPPWAAARVFEEGVPTAVREGAWTGESALLARDGCEIPVSQVLLAHKDEDGGVRFLSTIARDISERRELEAQLRQAQKLEAVGRLAGGIAHDFNNLLTAIGGYSLLLLDQLDREDPLREDVEEIAKAGELAAALTQQLLVFSRRQVLEPQVLDLNTVVADVETLLRRLIREDVTLVTRLAARPVPVSADPGQLSQVIVNLVVNAEDAMPTGGLLTIETTTFDIDESYARAHALPGEGRYAVLRVSDTGVGMDEQTRAQIFEPFFTTKPRAKGTGLGLATVFGIVEQSGGHIFVSSAVGAGTTFSIYLPLAAAVPVEGRTASSMGEALAGHESVLLVEDDDAVRSLTRNVLRMRGYTVVEAADGEEALRLVDSRAQPCDLVITDLVMPGLSGRELAERLTQRWPRLRVLFISGYTDDAIFRFGALDSGHEFLQKPFTPGLLARRVREILDVPAVQQA